MDDLSANELMTVFDHAIEGITRIDAEGRFRQMNRQFAAMLQRETHELNGNHWTVAVDHEDMALALEAYENMLAHGRADVSLRGLRKDGTAFHQHLVLAKVTNLRHRHICTFLFALDISEQVRREHTLHELVLRDDLTGLFNRRGFETKGRAVVALARRLGINSEIIWIDLDRFKAINDRHGHPIGDRVLRQFADALERSVRGCDIVARMGGDEFAILLANTNQDSQVIIQRITENVDAALREMKLDNSLSFSVGRVQVQLDDPLNFEQLLTKADRRMYQQKQEKTHPNSAVP